jgi:hypothetical protein
MGGRLSKPKGVDGMSEAPISLGSIPKRGMNPRVSSIVCMTPRLVEKCLLIKQQLFMAPMAAFTMAGIVVLYTRSSIRAAKLNVERRREQGGGQIDWGLESQRNHGVLEKIDTAAINKEAILGKSKSDKESKSEKKS